MKLEGLLVCLYNICVCIFRNAEPRQSRASHVRNEEFRVDIFISCRDTGNEILRHRVPAIDRNFLTARLSFRLVDNQKPLEIHRRASVLSTNRYNAYTYTVYMINQSLPLCSRIFIYIFTRARVFRVAYRLSREGRKRKRERERLG